jgi:acyl-CoA thioesterase-1
MRGFHLGCCVLAYGAKTILRKLNSVSVTLVFLTLPLAAEPVIVAALGDSLTQGYGLPPEKGFVPTLESWLKKRGVEAEILNAGVSGDTTAGGLARVDWTLTPEVDVMIVALGGNDLLRGLPPEDSRANLDGILKRAGEKDIPVLLAGLNAPGNFGPEYRKSFDAMYPELAQNYGVLYFESFLAGLEMLGDRSLVLRDYMQPDGIHPNASGVELIVDAIGPAVLDLIAQVD